MDEASYIEVRLPACVAGLDAGDLLSRLEALEPLGLWEEDGLLHLYWPASRWQASHLQGLHQVLEDFGIDGQSIHPVVERVPWEDWNAAWAASVRPIRIGRRVVVRPSWEILPEEPGTIVLVIDPKQAFGTGHHPTTQLVTASLEELIQGGEQVLDVGTGSGILAMASLRFGARSAVGIDVDPVAIGCARDYAAANGFGNELTLMVGDAGDRRLDDRYDVILANLDQRTLCREAARLRERLASGGTLVVSGLLADDLEAFIEAYSAIGVVLERRWEKQGWAALELKVLLQEAR